VIVYPYEIERLCPADWCHIQDRIPLVEGRETGCYQLETGTIVVRDPTTKNATSVALYARISSMDQKNDLERQMERLKDYAAAQGYHVIRILPVQ
jgi:predicted site-specific integrase-resolvase